MQSTQGAAFQLTAKTAPHVCSRDTEDLVGATQSNGSTHYPSAPNLALTQLTQLLAVCRWLVELRLGADPSPTTSNNSTAPRLHSFCRRSEDQSSQSCMAYAVKSLATQMV